MFLPSHFRDDRCGGSVKLIFSIKLYLLLLGNLKDNYLHISIKREAIRLNSGCKHSFSGDSAAEQNNCILFS